VKIVGISGSLRAGSSNAALLRAAAALAPEGVEVVVFEGIGGLPHFSPDLDTDDPPQAVRAFRALLAAADGFLVSTPEYAHGVPGSLKNAFDWIVSSGELYGKPLLLINASSSGGAWAQASLTEILTTMDARVLKEATVAVPLARKKLAVQGDLSDPAITEALTLGLQALVSAVRAS
jgi:chromate reductase, NAD(P)H dehydrogenase (quinone)